MTDMPLPREDILTSLKSILKAYNSGIIKAETMPEDARPVVDADSRELVHYLTFPMALNYQRNSYTLWENALKLYNDSNRKYVFYPSNVVGVDFDILQRDLIHYKVALQPNKHVMTWSVISKTIFDLYNNDVRNIFIEANWDIASIKESLQIKNKKRFPYLSGNKIANYWLYVLSQYTDLPFTNLSALTVAPDTHVIQASIQLGLIDSKQDPALVADLWSKILSGTGISPISIHTPLWLWSRSNFAFKPEV